jgi:hypothetical protein
LRKAEHPLTPREIALRLIEAKGVKDAPAAAISRVASSTLSALQAHKGKGLVSHASTHPIRWSVV